MSIPRRIRRRVPNSVPTGAAVWQLPHTLELVTHYPPPPPMPPGVLTGDLYLAYVHSQMNPQTWTKVGANRTASQYFWTVDSLKPPMCPPCVWRGNLFGVYPFPYEFAHVSQIWCQSAQPFGSFSRICAKVSSAVRHCTRWLAQNHAKKTTFIHRKLKFRPEHADINVTTFLHSNFRSVQWRARRGVNDILPACIQELNYIYIDREREIRGDRKRESGRERERGEGERYNERVREC